MNYQTYSRMNSLVTCTLSYDGILISYCTQYCGHFYNRVLRQYLRVVVLITCIYGKTV